jgi:hypothetical protein
MHLDIADPLCITEARMRVGVVSPFPIHSRLRKAGAKWTLRSSPPVRSSSEDQSPQRRRSERMIFQR